jgi:monofunctional biosynthetic peptidoglycan transglycosylase
MVAISATLLFIYHSLIVVSIFRLRRSEPVTSAIMERRAEQALAQGRALKKEHIWVPYESISSELVRAVIASEDRAFFQHSGLDWEQIKKSLALNWSEKRLAVGASTISQQLAKNLFLSPSKNPLRKLHEALIAKEMEYILGKRRILELYLNTIEWGDGIYGAEAAARHYFNSPAASLNADQAVFLALIIPDLRKHNDPASSIGMDPRKEYRIRALMEHPLFVFFELRLRGGS